MKNYYTMFGLKAKEASVAFYIIKGNLKLGLSLLHGLFTRTGICLRWSKRSCLSGSILPMGESIRLLVKWSEARISGSISWGWLISGSVVVTQPPFTGMPDTPYHGSWTHDRPFIYKQWTCYLHIVSRQMKWAYYGGQNSTVFHCHFL